MTAEGAGETGGAAATADGAALAREVAAIRWFHRIDLGAGVVTPGIDDTPAKLARLGLPDDLRGKTVLDIGAWDGFFSFEAERRGAARVLAVDSYTWSGQGGGGKAGFALARRARASRVEDLECDLFDLAPEQVGTFDVVLFLGVLYHLRHPLLALERLAALTRGQLILETVVDLAFVRRPAMVFYPADELNRDPTNWWGANPRAVRSLLEAAGFRRVVEHSRRSSLPRAVAGAVWRRLARGEPFLAGAQQNRAVFHAWK